MQKGWDAFMEDKQLAKNHRITIHNRKTAIVTGVLDVLAFDLSEILLETEQGMMMVKGTDLHVNRLDLEKGEVDLSGTVDTIAYSDAQAKERTAESIFSKLFR